MRWGPASRALPRAIRAAVVCCLAATWLASLVAPPEARAAAPSAPAPLPCVSQRAEARYSGVGYDHWVHITSTCERDVSCEVTTNVNPDTMTVTVKPNTTESVLTWRGSPAREFSATVSCRYADSLR